jgi:hypothetical protein
VHLASDQKDLLISQLKAEIFEIQQRDKDFLALRDQLHSIQSKYRHLQDEKVSLTAVLERKPLRSGTFYPFYGAAGPLKLPLETMF